ncbi:MAG: DUF3412 domain-containing protein [Spirochaetes bacterium]|nr:DUF3412 domain-containing protein [Spirochaetota bacterium]
MSFSNVEFDLDDHFPPHLIAEAEKAFRTEYRAKLVRIVEGILLARRGGYLETHDPNFDLELRGRRSTLRVVIKGVPETKLVNGRLIRQKELQIMAGIRDLLFSRLVPMEGASSEAITEHVFNFVRNAGLLTPLDYANNPYGRVMIQGGHHIPHEESVHHKRLGFGMGLLGLEGVTGSGPGSMEDPFKGALRGSTMMHLPRKFIGITEDGIISGEPCNDYIDHLIVFPDIEKRLEAFVRMSRAGLMVPGGVGTLEEILTILWIKTHPRNQGLHFPLYFCQPVQSGAYFKSILEFLELCFGVDFIEAGHLRYFVSDGLAKDKTELDPRRVAFELWNEMEENAERSKRESGGGPETWGALWNWDLYFPESLQKPLAITHPFVESLRFERGMPMEDLFFSLRSLCSALVETNVRDRTLLDRKGPFRVKGDPTILQAVDVLFQGFARDKRMGSREYRCPYVIVK